MKRGFTLIELLAVIVILAIIVIIATPIVLNIINDTKNSSQEKSVEMYINSVELSITNNMLNDLNNKPSGTYRIDDDGKKIIKIEEGKEVGNPIKVEYKGEGLTEGTIEIKEGKVTKLRGTKINGKYVAKVYDSIEFFDELPESTLTSSYNFNAKIKTLVAGKDEKYTTQDKIVTSIEFFSYGELPDGYTKEKLLKLEHVDVSNNQDKSILALYDKNGNVYIYSDKLIVFNKESSVMFSNFNIMTNLKFGLIDTSEVNSMSGMFFNDHNLLSLDLSHFDTRNVTNMSSMFSYCGSLKSLNISSFNTSKVTNMHKMFGYSSDLEKLDLTHFDTSNVTDMSFMFANCYLSELNINNFNTKKVKSMREMFRVNNLAKLDLSTFSTVQVLDMSNMFYGCSKLKLIQVSNNWIIGENTDITNIFDRCGTNIVTLK